MSHISRIQTEWSRIHFRPTELRRVWSEVNNRLIAAFERLTLEDWLHKTHRGFRQRFAKDPGRNRLAVVLSRTNHMSYHLGQIILAHSRTDAFCRAVIAPLESAFTWQRVGLRELWTEMGWYPMHAASCENLGS